MNLILDSAEKLRDNWKYILAEGLLPGLVEEKIITVAFQAAINAGVEWRVYNGMVDLRAIYRAYGETIAEAMPYQRIQLTPQTAHKVAGLIIMDEPAIVQLLVTMNGGTMPEILPPVVPAPPTLPEPPPTEEPPTDEPPAEEPPAETPPTEEPPTTDPE